MGFSICTLLHSVLPFYIGNMLSPFSDNDKDISNGTLLNKPSEKDYQDVRKTSTSLQRLDFQIDNTDENGSFSQSVPDSRNNNANMALESQKEQTILRKRENLDSDVDVTESGREQMDEGKFLLQIESVVSVISKNEDEEQNDENGNPKTLQPLIKHSLPERNLVVSTYESSYKQSLINIFNSRGFYVNTLSQVVDMFFISNFNLVIVDYVGDKGTPFDQGLFMLTVFAVGQLVGRLGLGWITDRKYLSRPIFLFWAMNVNAGLMVLFVALNSYPTLMVCGTILGIVGGTILPVSNVLFTDHLRKEDINLAIGLSISAKGLFYMIRIPLIGYCRDQIGSYDLLFYIMAGMSCLAAFAWLFEWTCLKTATKNTPVRIS